MKSVVWGLRLGAAYLAFSVLSAPASGRRPFGQGPELLDILAVLATTAVLALIASSMEKRRRRWLTSFRDHEAAALIPQLLAATRTEEPFFLYLRPFGTTGLLEVENPRKAMANPGMSAAYEEGTIEVESTLRDALDPFGTLVGLGRPGEHYGASRILTADADWKEAFELLAEKATLIFLLPSTSAGTLWEVSRLRERGWLAKTVIVMPPEVVTGGLSTAEMWEEARTDLRFAGLELPPHHPEGSLLVLAHSTGPEGVVGWMRVKQSRLERRLQELAGRLGVALPRRQEAGRRVDAPIPPAVLWALAFCLLIWVVAAKPQLPFLTTSDYSEITRASLSLSWLTGFAFLALFLFLLWESTYRSLRGRPLLLLLAFVAVASSPYPLLYLSPELFLKHQRPVFLPALILLGGALGIVVAILLGATGRRRWMITAAAITALTLGDLLDLGGLRIWELVINPAWAPSLTSLAAGACFGLALARILRWSPNDPANTRPPLGIGPFFVGWGILGQALVWLEWENESLLLWGLAGIGAGVVQAAGWHRQGCRLSKPRIAALVAGWGTVGVLCFFAGRLIEHWLDPSVVATPDWTPSPFLAERWLPFMVQSLLFGGLGFLIGSLLRRTPAASRKGERRPLRAFLAGSVFLGGALSLDAAYGAFTDGWLHTAPTPYFPLLLALAGATASYLEAGADLQG